MATTTPIAKASEGLADGTAYSPLFKLLGELRNQIYALVIDPYIESYLPKHVDQKLKPDHHPILRAWADRHISTQCPPGVKGLTQVSRKVRQETLPIYYGADRNYELANHQRFDAREFATNKWLASLDHNVVANIQKFKAVIYGGETCCWDGMITVDLKQRRNGRSVKIEPACCFDWVPEVTSVGEIVEEVFGVEDEAVVTVDRMSKLFERLGDLYDCHRKSVMTEGAS